MTLLGWSLGPTEMIVIGVVAVLLFGKRLPEVGRELGRGLRQFKHSLSDTGKEISEARDAAREVTYAVRDIDSGPEPQYDYDDEAYDELAGADDEMAETDQAATPAPADGDEAPRPQARDDSPAEAGGAEEKTA